MSAHFKAALGLSNLKPEAKVTRAQSILDAMQSSGNFPNSSMPFSYTNVQNAINNLSSAIVAANATNSSAADTSHMHAMERLLVSLFNILRSHVEYVANTTADASTMIVSAGMITYTGGGLNAVSELTLNAAGNGSINVRVPRGGGEKAFIFETSTDGTTFIRNCSTTLSRIILSGYTPGSTIYVRYFGISKNGDGQMSQAKSVMVV